MKIELMNIDDIIPYENNAKLHPKEQIEQIKKSILEFGNNDPIAIDKNNVVIEGHGRLLALKELDYKEVTVIKLAHLTDEQRKAYTLIHNKLTMNTGFDMDILIEELQAIEDIDMAEFDFDLKIEDVTDDDSEEELNTESNFNYKEQYGVIVMCKDEIEQEEIYNKLLEEGYECKVVAT